MSEPPASSDKGPPFSDASIWMSRVTTMVAPGFVGLWADQKFGTKSLGLIGFLVGLTAGITQIVLGSRKMMQRPRKKPGQGGPEEKS